MKLSKILMVAFLLFIFTLSASASIPPTPISCSSVAGTTWVNVSCSAGVGNVTDGFNFTNVNLGTWSNGTAVNWNNTGLSEGTSYEYYIYAFNNTDAGNLSIEHATTTKSTSTSTSSSFNLAQVLADFTAIAAILESTGIIFTALIGLVIILVPLVIVIAIAKFIPDLFQRILDMFKFR